MRYFGGKQRISREVSSVLSSYNMEYYAEPFCGSCNVASNVAIENKILNDKHVYLIEMFKALQNGWTPPETISEAQYKYIRNNLDEDKALSGFVGFGCSFAGKWFGGYARDTTTRNYTKNAQNSILKKMKTLQSAKFISKDFSELNFINTLVYCDPPYKNTTPYNKKLLGEFDYTGFIDWAKEQSKENIVIISEYKRNVPNEATIILEMRSKADIRDKEGKIIPTTEVLFTFNEVVDGVCVLKEKI